MTLPVAVEYGKVVWRAASAVADGPDDDDLPDGVPVTGSVTFTPSARVLLVPGAAPPVTVFATPVTCQLDMEGVLRDPEGRDGITLLATNSAGVNPTDWSWTVSFSLSGGVQRGPFSFKLPAGSTVDLTTAAPVPASGGTPIVQGPPGPQGPQGPPGAGAPPASGTDYGSIKLAGDVGGTAAAPTVPGLAQRERLISRTGATAGQVPVLQGDGTLAFGEVGGGSGLPGGHVTSAAVAGSGTDQAATLQAEIDALSAAGGGVVLLPRGVITVSAVQMKSRVIVAAPPMESSLWGFNSDPAPYNTTTLVATATSGPVVNFAANVVGAGLHNVLIKANGRPGVSFAKDGNTRGANALRHVHVNSAGGVGVYVGAMETTLDRVLVLQSTGDGIQIDAQDCELTSILSGYNGGNGMTLTTASGPVRMHTADLFYNSLSGLEINGHHHMISTVQTDQNGRRGIYFRDTTGSTVANFIAQNNGRAYLTAPPTRYADVEFGHPTAGNLGCALVSGRIYTDDGVESRALLSTEAVVTNPKVIGVSVDGTYASGGSAVYDRVFPWGNFSVRGSDFPDIVIPYGGVAGHVYRSDGGTDNQSFVDGSGVQQAGVGWNGVRFAPHREFGHAAAGAFTFDASLAEQITVTQTANVTSSSIINGREGQLLTIEWIQGGAGNFTRVWPSTCKFAGGAAPATSTTAGWSDVVTFRYVAGSWREISRVVALR